jgi:dolichyl-phosphate-mannose-protein mannosyltransferase
MFLPMIGLLVCWIGVMMWDENNKALGFVKGMILWSTFVLFTIEALSVPRWIVPHSIMISWETLILIILTLLIKRDHLHSYLLKQPLFHTSNDPYSILILTPVFIVAAITLAIGLISPPNNWDSMTYHLSRVEHWRANASVSHYPTNSVWQLYLSPFAEFVILHFQVLGRGSDHFANLVQWLFFLAAMAATGSIVKTLGGNAKAQCISVLAVATTPMVIMQATSTQNDLVCGFFVVAVALFSLRISLQRKPNDSLYLALAAALAVATKGTAYVFIPPFIIWALWQAYRKEGTRAMLGLGALVWITMLLINGGHWIRNFHLWGQPLGDPEWLELYRNHIYGLKQLGLSVLLNTLLHLGTPFVHVNSFLEQIASWAASAWAGLSLHDPALNFAWKHTFKIDLRTHDTFAGNALLVALLLGAVGHTVLRGSSVCRRYAALWFTSALMFCFLLKWAPYNTRLHTPLFMLGAAFIGVFACSFEAGFRAAGQYRVQLAAVGLAMFAVLLISGLSAVVGVQTLSESAVVRTGFFLVDAIAVMACLTLIVMNRGSKELLFVTLACLLTLGSLPWLLCNETRPLFSLKYQASVFHNNRIQGYFAERHALAVPYISIVRWLDKVPGCSVVGIKSYIDGWEYPLWALSTDERVARRFVHTGVSNASARETRRSLGEGQCAIIAIEQPEWQPEAIPDFERIVFSSGDASLILHLPREAAD